MASPGDSSRKRKSLENSHSLQGNKKAAKENSSAKFEDASITCQACGGHGHIALACPFFIMTPRVIIEISDDEAANDDEGALDFDGTTNEESESSWSSLFSPSNCSHSIYSYDSSCGYVACGWCGIEVKDD